MTTAVTQEPTEKETFYPDSRTMYQRQGVLIQVVVGETPTEEEKQNVLLHQMLIWMLPQN